MAARCASIGTALPGCSGTPDSHTRFDDPGRSGPAPDATGAMTDSRSPVPASVSPRTPIEAPAARVVCVSLHALAPNHWRQSARISAALRAVADVPLTWLVVPDLHGRNARVTPAYLGALEAGLARGDELALHGYHLRDDSPPPVELLDRIRRRFHGRGEAEFAALPEIEARARLVRGREWFRRHGWPLAGFVPPAGLLSPGAARAVRALGFEYTTTLGALHVLAAGRRVRAPCLGWSVPGSVPLALARAWNEKLARASRGTPVLRLALHPADAERRDVVAQAQKLLAHALRDRTPLTQVALARALATEAPALDKARPGCAPAKPAAGAVVRAVV
jgi:predicted deacetylase